MLALTKGDRRWHDSRFVALGAAALAVAVAAALALTAQGHATSAARQAPSCPLPGGVVRVFQPTDVRAVGGGFGPTVKKGVAIGVALVNKQGGILGCKLVVDVVDEGFPDAAVCIRKYRDAILSKKYTVAMAPFNSACLRGAAKFTNQAKMPLIANQAADHQPFLEDFGKYNFNAFVSALGEARASAKFAKDRGWKRIAILTPNYAYGQDIGSLFEEYFLRIVPDGKIVAKQYPPFGEKNMQPYVNAVLDAKPDAVVGGQFGGDVLTLWKLWNSQKLTVPTLFYGSIAGPFADVRSASTIPPNSYGYGRGYWAELKKTPVGKQIYDAYRKLYGRSSTPYPSEYVFSPMSGFQMMRSLAQKTNGFSADAWAKQVDRGGFTYSSPYHAGPTRVSSIDHMADTCPTVARVIWSKQFGATYDPKQIQTTCLNQVFTAAEAKRRTDR